LCNPNLGSEYWEPILRGPSLTLWIRSSSKQYLKIQSVPQRKHTIANINWLMLFRTIDICLLWKSYETYEYTLCVKRSYWLKAGGTYNYHQVLNG
jgi:hypothetical protein